MAEDVFEPAVVGNGLLAKLSLAFRQGHGNGLGLDLARPSPGMGWLMHEAALADPTQAKQFLFKVFIASLDLTYRDG